MPRSQSESLSQDDVFDILSSARRRFVLYYLRKKGEPVELSELAVELAAWENETPIDELTKQQRKRVYVSLYQTHIQKLADAGIVTYDKDSGMVTLARGARQIGAYLSVGSEESSQTRWQAYYITLAMASGIIYLLVTFDISIFALISELQIGLLIVSSFAAVAAIHYLQKRREETEIPAETLIQNSRRR